MTRDSGETSGASGSAGGGTDSASAAGGGSQDSHVVSARRIEAEGIEVASGRAHRIEILPMGTIHVRLMDWAAQEPAAGVAYTIRNVDGGNLTGETDDDGVLRHEDVTAGYYVLEVEDQHATVFTVPDPDEPEIVRLVLRDPPDADEEEGLQLGPDEDVQGEGAGQNDGPGLNAEEASPWPPSNSSP